MKTFKQLLVAFITSLSLSICSALDQPIPFWISDWELDNSFNALDSLGFSGRIGVNYAIGHTNVQSILISNAYPNGYIVTIVTTNRPPVTLTNTP